MTYGRYTHLWLWWFIEQWALSHVSFHRKYWQAKIRLTKMWWDLRPWK